MTSHAYSGTDARRAGVAPFLIGDSMTGGYGTGANILHGCTIAVEKGEIAVIVGPNGAGKSTAMKAIFGMLNLREGSVASTARTSPTSPRRTAWPRAWPSCRRPTTSSPR
jgi:ABC-type multidrug transport system ATPase subunit